MRWACVWILFAVVALSCSFGTTSFGAELQAVPNVYQFEGDQIWVVKRDGRHNTIVRKMDVERLEQTRGVRIRGPRGGEITFCPPGGCDPQPTPPQQEPPKFDMPGEEQPPKLDLPAASTDNADISLATIAAVAAGALGAFAGYKQQMNDPDLVEEAVKSEKSTTPALEVVK